MLLLQQLLGMQPALTCSMSGFQSVAVLRLRQRGALSLQGSLLRCSQSCHIPTAVT